MPTFSYLQDSNNGIYRTGQRYKNMSLTWYACLCECVCVCVFAFNKTAISIKRQQVHRMCFFIFFVFFLQISFFFAKIKRAGGKKEKSNKRYIPYSTGQRACTHTHRKRREVLSFIYFALQIAEPACFRKKRKKNRKKKTTTFTSLYCVPSVSAAGVV